MLFCFLQKIRKTATRPIMRSCFLITFLFLTVLATAANCDLRKFPIEEPHMIAIGTGTGEGDHRPPTARKLLASYNSGKPIRRNGGRKWGFDKVLSTGHGCNQPSRNQCCSGYSLDRRARRCRKLRSG